MNASGDNMSGVLVETNKMTYQHLKSIQDSFQQIASPLSNLGINYFGHFKIYNDGTFFHDILKIHYYWIEKYEKFES